MAVELSWQRRTIGADRWTTTPSQPLSPISPPAPLGTFLLSLLQVVFPPAALVCECSSRQDIENIA